MPDQIFKQQHEQLERQRYNEYLFNEHWQEQEPQRATPTSSIRTPALLFFIPPYVLKRGPIKAVCYVLISLVGFLSFISVGPLLFVDWMQIASIPTWHFGAFFVTLLVLHLVSAHLYKEYHNGPDDWRSYVLGGGWAWRFVEYVADRYP